MHPNLLHTPRRHPSTFKILISTLRTPQSLIRRMENEKCTLISTTSILEARIIFHSLLAHVYVLENQTPFTCPLPPITITPRNWRTTINFFRKFFPSRSLFQLRSCSFFFFTIPSLRIRNPLPTAPCPLVSSSKPKIHAEVKRRRVTGQAFRRCVRAERGVKMGEGKETRYQAPKM